MTLGGEQCHPGGLMNASARGMLPWGADATRGGGVHGTPGVMPLYGDAGRGRCQAGGINNTPGVVLYRWINPTLGQCCPGVG